MQAVTPPRLMRPCSTSMPASRVTLTRPMLSTTLWMPFSSWSEVLACTAVRA